MCIRDSFNSAWVSPDVNSDSTLLLDINYTIDNSNNNITLVVDNPDLMVNWSTGFVGDTLVYNLGQMMGDSVLITAEGVDNIGRSATSIISVINPPGQSAEVCYTSFQYELEITNASFPLDNNSVVIEYQKNGVEYSSVLDSQPSNSFFTISEIEDFQRNENDFPTFRFKVDFDVLLFNTDTGESSPFSGEGYIGVAYPN